MVVQNRSKNYRIQWWFHGDLVGFSGILVNMHGFLFLWFQDGNVRFNQLHGDIMGYRILIQYNTVNQLYDMGSSINGGFSPISMYNMFSLVYTYIA
jgi:hypothetical protein